MQPRDKKPGVAAPGVSDPLVKLSTKTSYGSADQDGSSAGVPRVSIRPRPARGTSPRPGVATYLEEPFRQPFDEAWERVRRDLYGLAESREGEIGERADRLLLESGGTFVPAPVYRAARAVGWLVCGLAYVGERRDRIKINAALRPVMNLAARVESKLRRAA